MCKQIKLIDYIKILFLFNFHKIVHTFPQAPAAASTMAPIYNDEGCHPTPNPSVAHFIVGYGSLIETASKERTVRSTGPNIPILVQGFRREWNLKGDDLGPINDLTYLGVTPNRSSAFNGVFFQLPPTLNIVEALQSFDRREIYYCRQQVPPTDIQVLSSNGTMAMSDVANQNGQFWIYVNKPQFIAPPSKDFPIVQSYVDVFISGCLEIQENFKIPDFARLCVDMTSGWGFWVNDRIFPRRPGIHQPKAGFIDAILNARIPREFQNIRLEP